MEQSEDDLIKQNDLERLNILDIEINNLVYKINHLKSELKFKIHERSDIQYRMKHGG